MVNITTDANGPDVKFQSPVNNSNYSVDDVKIFFYTNDSTINFFEYTLDGANWYDTRVCDNSTCSNGTIYNMTLHNLPEGTTKIKIRGNDSNSNVGQADERWVNIDSIYTNLIISVTAPTTSVTGTPFTARVNVYNGNEENTTSSVQVKLVLPSGCTSSNNNWVNLGTLEAGKSDGKSWSVTCQTGSHQLVGWMNYTVQNKQKNATKTVNTVYSYSMLTKNNGFKLIQQLIKPIPKKAYKPPEIQARNAINVIT
jgi:hypothetical protein